MTQLGSGLIDYCAQECLNRSTDRRAVKGAFIQNHVYARYLRTQEVLTQLATICATTIRWLQEQIDENMTDHNLGDVLEGVVMYLLAQEDNHAVCELLCRHLPELFLSKIIQGHAYYGDWGDLDEKIDEPAEMFGW